MRIQALSVSILVAACSCMAQTNTPPVTNASGVASFFKPLLTATNYAYEAYGTYAPKAPKGSQWGGGLMAAYNLSDYVAPVLGADYLGHFTLMSGGLTLKLPNHPLQWTHWSWASNVTDTPFLLATTGVSLGGTGNTGGGGLVTTTGGGAYIGFGHVLGGQMNIGAEYGKWFNAGPYSVARYHLFAGVSWGF